jgi:hypothetical protein
VTTQTATRPLLTGTQVQDGIIDAARKLGYLATHFREMRATEPGWPDVVVVGFGKLCLWECKSRHEPLVAARVAPRSGRLLPGQADWIDAFRQFGVWVGTDTHLSVGVVRDVPESDDEWGYDEAVAELRDWRETHW